MGRFALDGTASDLVALAREHNLLTRWRPAANEALEHFGGPVPGAPVPKPAPKGAPPPLPVPKGAPRAR
jgi:hypothetical protein